MFVDFHSFFTIFSFSLSLILLYLCAFATPIWLFIPFIFGLSHLHFWRRILNHFAFCKKMGTFDVYILLCTGVLDLNMFKSLCQNEYEILVIVNFNVHTHTTSLLLCLCLSRHWSSKCSFCDHLAHFDFVISRFCFHSFCMKCTQTQPMHAYYKYVAR